MSGVHIIPRRLWATTAFALCLVSILSIAKVTHTISDHHSRSLLEDGLDDSEIEAAIEAMASSLTAPGADGAPGGENEHLEEEAHNIEETREIDTEGTESNEEEASTDPYADSSEPTSSESDSKEDNTDDAVAVATDIREEDGHSDSEGVEARSDLRKQYRHHRRLFFEADETDMSTNVEHKEDQTAFSDANDVVDEHNEASSSGNPAFTDEATVVGPETQATLDTEPSLEHSASGTSEPLSEEQPNAEQPSDLLEQGSAEQSTTEQPSELSEHVSEEQPASEQPSEVSVHVSDDEPASEQPSEVSEHVSEEQPASEQPAEVSEEQPASEQPSEHVSEEQPASEQPAEVSEHVSEEQPPSEQPAEVSEHVSEEQPASEHPSEEPEHVSDDHRNEQPSDSSEHVSQSISEPSDTVLDSVPADSVTTSEPVLEVLVSEMVSSPSDTTEVSQQSVPLEQAGENVPETAVDLGSTPTQTSTNVNTSDGVDELPEQPAEEKPEEQVLASHDGSEGTGSSVHADVSPSEVVVDEDSTPVAEAHVEPSMDDAGVNAVVEEVERSMASLTEGQQVSAENDMTVDEVDAAVAESVASRPHRGEGQATEDASHPTEEEALKQVTPAETEEDGTEEHRSEEQEDTSRQGAMRRLQWSLVPTQQAEEDMPKLDEDFMNYSSQEQGSMYEDMVQEEWEEFGEVVKDKRQPAWRSEMQVENSDSESTANHPTRQTATALHLLRGGSASSTSATERRPVVLEHANAAGEEDQHTRPSSVHVPYLKGRTLLALAIEDDSSQGYGPGVDQIDGSRSSLLTAAVLYIAIPFAMMALSLSYIFVSSRSYKLRHEMKLQQSIV